MVERVFDSGEIGAAVSAQVGAFREVLPQKPVRVLVGAALPGTAGVAEVDRGTGGGSDVEMAGHFGALVPGDRLQQQCGQAGKLAQQPVSQLDRVLAG